MCVCLQLAFWWLPKYNAEIAVIFSNFFTRFSHKFRLFFISVKRSEPREGAFAFASTTSPSGDVSKAAARLGEMAKSGLIAVWVRGTHCGARANNQKPK